MATLAITRQRSFDDLGAALCDVPFCVLDLETTGASPAQCEITEIGAVKYLGGEPQGTFHTLVNPGAEIPPFITVLTGITEAMVVEAPRIEEALPSLLEFVGDAVIVGHNVRFDMSFLNAAAERLGYGRLPNRTADTAALARRLVRPEVRNLRLATLAAHFRSPEPPIHRALEDAKATAHVFWALLERAGTLGVTHLDDLMALPSARGTPHYGKLQLTEGAPRRPGVYLFRDRVGAIFYVGKAKDLRSRVRSYFYGDERRRITTMLQELHRIDYRVCATELEAAITELRLINAHRPRHNRRSKPPKATWFVKMTAERFPRLSMVRAIRHGDGPYLGPFRSRRQAERVVTALWDAVPIRRCTGRPGSRASPCAYAQLGVAACPCAGTVDESSYAVITLQLRAGIEQRPALLLDPLRRKMVEHAASQRFEEAGWVRDRYRALAGALARRRTWQALGRAGLVRAHSTQGDWALVDRGVLAASWRGSTPPLLGTLEDGAAGTATEVPPTVAAADEAELIWRWLADPSVRLAEVSGSLSMPAGAVPELGPIEDEDDAVAATGAAPVAASGA